jgi:hypothetical protein
MRLRKVLSMFLIFVIICTTTFFTEKSQVNAATSKTISIYYDSQEVPYSSTLQTTGLVNGGEVTYRVTLKVYVGPFENGLIVDK